MIRILHVIGSMNCGGAETMIMNIYRCIDRSKIQFDFVLHTDKSGFYDKEILELGGNIYRTEKYNVKNIYSYSRWWNQFFASHNEYKIIHGHINSSAAIYLSIAKKYGLHTIVHSHATRITERSFRSLVFLVSSFPVRYIADSFMACSLQAGIDRFGKRVVNSDRFMVLPNGIVGNQYRFNSKIRNNIRKRYHVDKDTIVVGHVGRFTYAKNHDFLIDVFNLIHQEYTNTILWLIGSGELEDRIKEKVKSLGLEKSVIFMGIKSNVYDYLQGMDCFIFPSHFEGLGIALVEAQASGLCCIASEAIQIEADIGANLLTVLPIGKEKYTLWLETFGTLNTKNRADTYEKLCQSGYEISSIAKRIFSIYLSIYEKGNKDEIR